MKFCYLFLKNYLSRPYQPIYITFVSLLTGKGLYYRVLVRLRKRIAFFSDVDKVFWRCYGWVVLKTRNFVQWEKVLPLWIVKVRILRPPRNYKYIFQVINFEKLLLYRTINHTVTKVSSLFILCFVITFYFIRLYLFLYLKMYNPFLIVS